jgi:hypothetical protein
MMFRLSQKGQKARLGVVAIVLLALVQRRTAAAHSPTFMMFSKFEATTNARSIAFVFALDEVAALQLIERDVAHSRVEPSQAANFSDFLATYIFDRFFVSNDGARCRHSDALGRVLRDERYKRVLAVTKFTCDTDLGALTIRSYLTRDTPPPHELVGDLVHGRALVRNFFYGDDGDSAEAHIDLRSLPQTGEVIPTRLIRSRGQFSYVPVPTRDRLYDGLARVELGTDSLPESPYRPQGSRKLRSVLWGLFAGAVTLRIALHVWNAHKGQTRRRT